MKLFLFNKNISAFTLAETLITLVIIGVVAAIAVPTIHNNSQKKQTVTQLRKMHSELCQAVSMAQTIHGDPSHWDYDLNHYNFFKEYLFPFVQVSQDKVKDVKKHTTYRKLSGVEETSLYVMQQNSEVVNLISGNQIFIGQMSGVLNTANRRCYLFDTNGYKKPNKIGRDLFMYCIVKGKGVVAYTASSTDYESTNTNLTRAQLKQECNKSSTGLYCAALIMKDGWQIKDDYPW